MQPSLSARTAVSNFLLSCSAVFGRREGGGSRKAADISSVQIWPPLRARAARYFDASEFRTEIDFLRLVRPFGRRKRTREGRKEGVMNFPFLIMAMIAPPKRI